MMQSLHNTHSVPRPVLTPGHTFYTFLLLRMIPEFQFKDKEIGRPPPQSEGFLVFQANNTSVGWVSGPHKQRLIP